MVPLRKMRSRPRKKNPLFFVMAPGLIFTNIHQKFKQTFFSLFFFLNDISSHNHLLRVTDVVGVELMYDFSSAFY